MKPRNLSARSPAKLLALEDRIPLNILFGLPDDERVTIRVTDEGKGLNFTLPGTVDILPHLSLRRFDMEVIYLQRELPRTTLRPRPLLNHIGDADICSQALRAAAHIVRETAQPCFNHPGAVTRTTRDEASRILSGIAGLTVPKTICSDAPRAAELRAAVENAGLNYPILIRVAGSHRGLNMIRADSPGGVSNIDRLDRRAQPSLYVTEFRDFVSPDGLYRKFRIAIVGEDIFLRHLVLSKHWLIHGGTGASNTEEEAALFASFEGEHAGHLQDTFREMARRLDLDFFGVDCNINQSGEVLLFEANACMRILGITRRMSNVKAAGVTRIHQAVEDRLASPATWRHHPL